MDILRNLFGNPFLRPLRNEDLWNAAGGPFQRQPLRAPLIGYGQRFEWGNGAVSVEGCSTSEMALWRAAHMLYHSVTPRKMRRVMNKDQRARLIEIAWRKLVAG